MTRVASLTIHKEEIDFSAGHFTIFSATEREQLHGHNYYVSMEFDFAIEDNGLSFDYREYKRKLVNLCKTLDRHFLLPGNSPYLPLAEDGEYWHAYFNEKKLVFLKDDVVILPITNVTIEELSHWFLLQMLEDKTSIMKHAIHRITINVFNGPGQSAAATWTKTS